MHYRPLTLNFATLVVLILSAMVLMTGADGVTSEVLPWPDNPVQDYAPFLFGDLVVHGRVSAFKEERVPMNQLRKYTIPSDAGVYGAVSRVTIDVNEVMKGVSELHHVTFVMRAWVRADVLRRLGTEVVVALRWNPTLLGGTYELPLAEGLYAFDGQTFVSQGEVKGGRRHSLRELKGKIETVRLDSVAREADGVFVGTVESMSDSNRYADENGQFGTIRRTVFRVDDVVFGEFPNYVTVTSVVYGTYWPQWRTMMPRRIAVGQQYYVLIRRAGDIIYVPGGVNGIFRIEGENLLYDNYFKLPLTRREFAKKVLQLKREGQ